MRRVTWLFVVTCAVSCGDDSKCESPGAVLVSIDSVPLTKPVTGDLVVFGHTKVPRDVTISGVRLGVRGPFSNSGAGTVEASSGSGDSFETWTGTVPLAVMLAPNNGPGTIEIEAVAESNCDDGAVTPATSVPIDVAYPMDAGVDAAGSGSGSASGSGS